MKKYLFILWALLACTALSAQEITLYPEEVIGQIKNMNSVNNGPWGSVSVEKYAALEIPLARTHDGAHSARHTLDIRNIFPDFDKDENDPASYDFSWTDVYLKRMIQAGTKPLYRLGNSNEPSLDGEAKKYGSWPPKDFKKWARICEHIIRHYNEGWADGFHYDIEYWEIWNEPDMDQYRKLNGVPRYKVAPHAWGGTIEQYYDFFSTAYKHLKKAFPHLKFGGPAFAEFASNEPFVKEMTRRGIKTDFYSWHRYAVEPSSLEKECNDIQAILDKYGWDPEIILDEWNYVSDWTPEETRYSREVRLSMKGYAFTAATMSHMQNVESIDILMYYDFRHTTTYNGAFEQITGNETQAYFAFYNWAKLKRYGAQIKVEDDRDDIYTTAAKNEDGRIRLMVTRYNNDDLVRDILPVRINVPEGVSEVTVTMNDAHYLNTEIPVKVVDGVLTLKLQPQAIAFVSMQ